MIIKDINIRACRQAASQMSNDMFRGAEHANKAHMEFLVVTLTTDTGMSASSFGFAGSNAEGSAALATSALTPLLKGRNPFEHAAMWQQFRTADRWWNHLPIYSYGPFDIALWLLCAQASNVPLYQYIGACRHEIEVYCSSVVLADIDAYVNDAIAVKEAGFKAYKVHPPGNSFEEDLEIHRAIRAGVGEDFHLMSDPVASLSFTEALRLARELEKLNYLWLEEPFYDENLHALRELRAAVNIPIIAAEVVAKHPYSVTDYITSRAVDGVRADVSWSGGITGVLKTAALAEAFHLNCELHSTIMHPLELVNLHCAAAINNTRYLELLTPLNLFDFGLKSPLPIHNGIATLPSKPGLGIELDWDFIDNSTLSVHRS